MKLSSLTAKLRKARQAAHPCLPETGKAQHAAPGGGGASIRKWSFALLVLALTAGATYAVFHFLLLSKIPYKMLGTWVVIEVTSHEGAKVEEALQGGRLEFRRDGTMIGTINMEGKEAKIKATVAVEGQTLRITTVNPHDGHKVTDLQTIRTLESDRLVLEDRQGTVLRAERLRE